MSPSDRFARRVFLAAAIYGLVVLLPLYLAGTGLIPDLPVPGERPEHFYGFVGVAVAWQVAFLVIARDPRRYRILIIPSILEKTLFGVPVILLFAAGRVGADVLAFGLVDLLLGVLFAAAYRSTGHVQAAA